MSNDNGEWAMGLLSRWAEKQKKAGRDLSTGIESRCECGKMVLRTRLGFNGVGKMWMESNPADAVRVEYIAASVSACGGARHDSNSLDAALGLKPMERVLENSFAELSVDGGVKA